MSNLFVKLLEINLIQLNFLLCQETLINGISLSGFKVPNTVVSLVVHVLSIYAEVILRQHLFFFFLFFLNFLTQMMLNFEFFHQTLHVFSESI